MRPPAGPPGQFNGHATGVKIKKYGMAESRIRLEIEGFHPAVTSKTPKEVIDDWLSMAAAHTVLPTLEDIRYGAFFFKGEKYSLSRKQLTRGFLALREQFLNNRPNWADKCQTLVDGNKSLLEGFLENVVIGSLITKYVFADGVGTVQNLALTSTRMWRLLEKRSYPWDFNGREFRHHEGGSEVFLVLNPEFTTREISHAVLVNPLGMDPNCYILQGHRAAPPTETSMLARLSVIVNARSLVRRDQALQSGVKRADAEPLNHEDEEYFECYPWVRTGAALHRAFNDFAVNRLNDHLLVTRRNQFIGWSLQVFRPLEQDNILGLQQLLSKISVRCARIQVLYFEKTPLLDRRILATILRGCPSVTVVGIYDCPLIHFGDIICILDLIHEINLERKKNGKCRIEGFDFSPRFHSGTPFQNRTAATYGVTWAAQDLEIVQRGMYMILMKAFFKSKAMGLGLLFSKDKAFMKYLSRVPTQPLGIPSFLTALYRYLELNSNDADYENLKWRIFYDLMKPVRLGVARSLDHFSGDWPVFFMTSWKHLIFCASCGYKTFQDFFTHQQQQTQARYRVCAGCLLQRTLDMEGDHLKLAKKMVLDSLFPKWSGLDFNLDAPMPAKALAIIDLESTVSHRPFPPSTYVNHNGHLTTPQYEEPLLRDGKIHQDSLRNLPTLAQLTPDEGHGKVWKRAETDALNLDKYRVCMMIWEYQHLKGGNTDQRFLYRTDPVWQDHPLERQVDLESGEIRASFNLKTAENFHAALALRRW